MSPGRRVSPGPVLYPKPERKAKRRGRSDPVSPLLRIEVIQRDGGCVAPVLGAEDPCRGPLTLDHVKDAARMGVRAPSDRRHLVTVCRHHHLDGWATSHRPALRVYLAQS